RVDRADRRVRVGRTDDERVRLVRQVHVVRVAPEALNEAGIFDTTYGLSDREFLDDDGITHDSAAVYARRRGSKRAQHAGTSMPSSASPKSGPTAGSSPRALRTSTQVLANSILNVGARELLRCQRSDMSLSVNSILGRNMG